MEHPDQTYSPGCDAHSLTRRLGGRWNGRYGTAPCPVCQPERRPDQNALTLASGMSGRLLLHCKKSNCRFRSILRAAGILARQPVPAEPNPSEADRRKRDLLTADRRRARVAIELWRAAKPAAGSLAERYLRRRGITCPLPSTLRFHPACFHGASKQTLPAMIALVEGGDGPALHRTWLSPEDRKAAVEPQKAMLGRVGGGVVRLTKGGEHLVVGEGIETAPSLASGLMQGEPTVWAALSTSGLRRLHLPSKPSVLTVAADGDAAGRAAAEELASRARRVGWQVDLMNAPEGMDWNAVLQGWEIAE